ncbi:uncharacterized protein CcaverHIS019_0303050 [Cutaneotrichosporon cavernicola]|uniref:BTB domain-containing protein n=1 Tax=Cutaneotrichosporon cavernicola TaxID=279322 RepID=A0AA48I9D4_9TREE|nr:uncharacterized protein CcaverHIS019_0303050 [Cutaneotrichosporon cavernicola]BEI90235.1 hypothetical protein CcaverHIS019_0303050 [Cutaneotrichosporon cavernicola]
MSCPSSPDTPFNTTFSPPLPAMPGMPGPLQPPKSPALKAAEAAARENGLGLSTLSPPITPAPLAPPLLPRMATPSRAPSPLPSRAGSPYPSRAPSPGPRTLAPPPIEDSTFYDGDFELISADNVRFRVQAYHLFSASTGLRAAAEWDDSGRARHFNFDDNELEAALVIRAFLRVITTGTVATTPDGSGTPSVSALRRLILFLRKWDCPVALQLVLFKVKELLNQGISVPMYTFILGATADDIETCSLALKHVGQSWNGAGYTDVRNEGTPGASTIDPTHLPYTLWSWVPSEYMWALSRAWGRNLKDGTRLPDEFKRALAVIKGGHSRIKIRCVLLSV